MIKDNKTTVSVVVISFNSSLTILETLESIKRQTYQYIELIVTDDSSTDNTVELVKKWLAENKCRFIESCLIESKINTGVPANLNRGIKQASGYWIKILAGDDLLVPNGIERYVSISKEVGFDICLARMKMFPEREKMKYASGYKILENMYKPIMTYNREKQYRTSLYRHILPSPALFYKRKIWEEIGGYTEKYNRSEELSFEVKIFDKYPVYFVDEFLVLWRQREDSLCHKNNTETVKQNLITFYLDVQRDKLKKEKMYLHIFDRDITVGLLEAQYENNHIKYWIMRLLSLFSVLRYIDRLRLFLTPPVFPTEKL